MDNLIYNIEKTILSTIIYNNSQLNTLIDKNFYPDEFTYAPHQIICKIMFDLYSENKEINEQSIHTKNKNIEKDLIEILAANPVTDISQNLNTLIDNRISFKYDLFAKQILNTKELEKKEKLAFEFFEQSDKNLSTYNEIEIVPLGKVSIEKIELTCDDYLPIIKKTCTLIIARGDTGKTFLILKNALHYKLSQIKSGTLKKCFCWFTEDDNSSVIKNREILIIKTFFSEEDQKLLLDPKYDDLICVASNPPFAFMHLENYRPIINNSFYALKRKLKEFELVIFDPLTTFYGGDENDNYYARQFMNIITNWASEANNSVVLLHNTPNNAKKARGAEAIRDAAKVSYIVDKIRDKDGNVVPNAKTLEIYIDKDNYNLKDTIANLKHIEYKKEKKTFRLEVFPQKG